MNPTRKKRMMVALVPGRHIRTGKLWPMAKLRKQIYRPTILTYEQWERMLWEHSRMTSKSQEMRYSEQQWKWTIESLRWAGQGFRDKVAEHYKKLLNGQTK